MISKACKKRFQIKSPTHQRPLRRSELSRTAKCRIDPEISFENEMMDGFRLLSAFSSSSLSS